MGMRTHILFLSGVYLAITSATGAVDTGDFRISSDLTVSEQNNPSLTANSDGSFAVVWEDYRNGQSDIYCQLYDSLTGVRGDNFIVNDDITGGWQLQPDIASDWHGSYYAIWKDYRNDGYPFGPDIYFQRIGLDGLIGQNRNISDEPPDSSHQSPAIDVTGWGRAVTCWTDLRNRNWDVFVRLMDSSGAPVSGSYRANDDAGLTPQHEPDVAVAPDGWFVAVWYDGRNGNDDIYLQKYDSGGNPIGVNRRVNDDRGTTKQKFPVVDIGDDGIIAVAWTDWRNGSYPANSDIYCQRFDSALNRLGVNQMINTYDGGRSQRHPRIVIDYMGYICVVWSDSSDGDWNTVGQMMDRNGIPLGDNFPVNTDTPGRQLHPDVALDGYRAYFAWADNRDGDFDIYGRVMTYNQPRLIATPSRIELDYSPANQAADTVSIMITNAGLGDLDYGVETDHDWLTVSKSSGRTPDSIFAILTYHTMSYGMHRGSIRLIDIAANDSSLHIPVVVTISTPMIATDPVSIVSMLYGHETENDSVQVYVVGSEKPAWSGSAAVPWLTLSNAGGTSGDYLTCTVSGSSMPPGWFVDHITLEDSSAGNSPFSLPCSLRVLMTDTIGTVAAQAERGQVFRQPVVLTAYNRIISGELVCEYDRAMISIDSFTMSSAVDTLITASFEGDVGQARFSMRIGPGTGQPDIPPDSYYFGDLWGTANDSLTGSTSITAISDSMALILDSAGQHIPVWSPEPIDISMATEADVSPDEKDIQPVFGLEQNRPNPFNSNTTISFSVARSGHVRVDVYNILGQLVRALVDGEFDAGPHTISWDGRDAAGRMMASGIFFYKLVTPEYSAVRKMVMLK